MEKEIYLTQALYATQSNDITPPLKEKTGISPFQTRPESAKLPNKKINNNFLPQSYYDDKRVKPGVSLYKLILEIEERRANNEYSGPYLHLAIPETVLLNDNSNSMIYTEEGIVKVEPFVSNEVFLKKIENSSTDSIFPYVLHSTISGINLNDSIMMNTEVIGNKIIPRSEGFICRKFVQPYAATPNILRLYFCPKGGRQLKKNYGYKLVHLKQMNEQMFKKKHRLVQNFIINTEREDTYTATLMSGKALETCIKMAESFIEYIEKGIFVKIGEMVMDFIVDEEKQPWLYEIKSVKSKLLTKLWDIGNKEELQLLTDKCNSSHYCKLCGMTYTRQQMEKIVTNKLIWQLIAHLHARGVPFKSPPHLRKEGLSYICDICYEVVVAEHKLINVEKEFSNLLNLSTNTVERVSISEPKVEPIIEETQEAVEAPGFKAWRLFFYIEKIKNYETLPSNKNFTINLQMKFNSQRQQFTKVVCGENPEQINCKSRFSSIVRVQSAQDKRPATAKLDHSGFSRKQSQSRLENGKTVETMTTMASKVMSSYTTVKENYSIQKVKVYVFYTKKSQTSNLFANTQLEFNLAINDEKFNGRSATLQALKNRDTCQRHSSEIFLFDQRLKYCNLQLTVGLICDGEVEGQGLGLECIDGIYYPRQGVSVCHPLPDQWMQVFTKGESVPTHTQQLAYKDIKSQQIRKESRLKQQIDLRISSQL